jgi:hypothetical protein
MWKAGAFLLAATKRDASPNNPRQTRYAQLELKINPTNQSAPFFHLMIIAYS